MGERLILWQKKKSGEVLVVATKHRSFSNGGNNDYGDSISDLAGKVKGKCEIEIFERKMFSVVIMFLVGNVKMYKYSKKVRATVLTIISKFVEKSG